MKLLVLTQNNCRYCGMVKQYLDDAEVDYETINMSDQPVYQEKYDVMGAPTVILLDDEEVIAKTTGFNPETLDTLIEQL
ncbi:glutaredoxin family protein [Cytobacillus praedii]|uniref:Glutaredoxin family protein n=1 Tax=Cytobacillus praedii TaxID=1742358 RepID=A0A4R1AUL6_9BACI|nr:glutaredoxin family protein [Cytobacillus praedii]TCJ01057.1 glutaredoxin family protein [Cytobacillus praedii]